MIRFSALIVMMLISSCASKKKEWDGNKKSPLGKALTAAFSRLGTSAGREIASYGDGSSQIKNLLPNLKGLTSSFEVVVFPKAVRGHLKDARKQRRKINKRKYEDPTIFRFSPLYSNSCSSLQNSSSGVFKAFPPFSLGGNKCVILEVRPMLNYAEESGRSPTSIRRDDLLSARILIDDSFRVYGVEWDKALVKGGGEVKTIRYPSNGKRSLDSGLSGFPIDLPNFFQKVGLSTQNFSGQGHVDVPLFGIEKGFLNRFNVRRYSKRNVIEGKIICDEGLKIRYRGPLGARSQAIWCKGDSWPTVIKSQNYLAIIRNGAENL